MKETLLTILLFFTLSSLFPQIDRIEPPFWWVGMKNPVIQVMMHGPGLSDYRPSLEAPGFILERVIHTENPNYLFLDIRVSSHARSVTLEVVFSKDGNKAFTQEYEFRERSLNPNLHRGFDSKDVIYMIMTDRFANGDPKNDTVEGMREKADRALNYGRHGGDLKGIHDHLDYLEELGITAIWLSPFLENDVATYSYHGYTISDHYKTDPRFGSNEDFLALTNACHDRGLKMIMDIVLNHCSVSHPLVEDLPFPGWINQWPEFTRSNYHVPLLTDPYVADVDREKLLAGWFDTSMADLNNGHEMVATYLIQNSIWWIEYAGLDGIRLDTQPYSDKDMVSRWGAAIMSEYPNFDIVGESWGYRPSRVAYWQAGSPNRDGYNSHLTSVMDFPLNFAIQKAFTEQEGWNQGIYHLYDVLGEDFVYGNPSGLVIFADNHDQTRFFTTIEGDLAAFKMAMAFVLTTRGIPCVYYGTEILMTGKEEDGHGYIRADFPGGWRGDDRDTFRKKGREEDEEEAFDFLQRILQWRKAKSVIHSGSLTHFRPENGIYVYFRSNEQETVMVAFNTRTEIQSLEMIRFSECIRDHSIATDILTGEEFLDLRELKMEARSVRILELK